jgi:peptide-methionine (S)-S-oxide reductase
MRLTQTLLAGSLLLTAAPSAASPRTETAVLAGGCFWGMESVFEHVKGVTDVVSGFAGGSARDASYDKVSTEGTGHAEAVRITYDPSRVSYAQLLQVYFAVAHDPTEVNRQGPDVGPSYRSAIFPQTASQEAQAKKFIAKLTAQHVFKAPIATRIEHGGFYPAEAYHQDYLTLHPTQGYIATYDIPKVQALKALFPGHYRTNPVLVAAAR